VNGVEADQDCLRGWRVVKTAALDLASKGLPVFPCRKENKAPYTDHGFKEASTDPATIAEWWTRWPDALIGVPAGVELSRLI
jgi:hypothetical protein